MLLKACIAAWKALEVHAHSLQGMIVCMLEGLIQLQCASMDSM